MTHASLQIFPENSPIPCYHYSACATPRGHLSNGSALVTTSVQQSNKPFAQSTTVKYDLAVTDSTKCREEMFQFTLGSLYSPRKQLLSFLNYDTMSSLQVQIQQINEMWLTFTSTWIVHNFQQHHTDINTYIAASRTMRELESILNWYILLITVVNSIVLIFENSS